MNSIRRCIQSFLQIPKNLYTSIMLKTDKRVFAAFFNFKSLLFRTDTRIQWHDGFYIVTDKSMPDFRYLLRHKRRCHFAYPRGVKKRSEYLADSYSFEEIGFEDGDVFVDCGANYGDVKIWFDVKSIDIEYIGFEPSPIEFGCLKENVRPGVVHNVGLWNTEGELKFYLSSDGADSSLIEPAHYDEVITTKVTRLDSYITSEIKCLKLEAEGAEPEILEGIGQKLDLIEYIAADLGYERGVEEESTLAPVTNFLLARNFELINVNHVRICALYRNKKFMT